MKKTENIALVLIKFSIPLILSGILQQLYSWADAFIVGNVEGEAALAAIGSTMSVVNFLVMAIIGFTIGISILTAQRYGAKKFEIIPGILSTFTVIVGVVFTLAAVAGSIFSPQILLLMRTDAQMLEPALDYLSAVFLGVPFLAVYNVYSAVLRGVGDSRAPFFAIVVSTAVNIFLDIIFVAMLKMGTFGAALATVIAQCSMAVFTVIYAVKKHKILRFGLSSNLLCKKAFTDGMRMGIPTMIQSCVTAFGSLVLQNFMNGFGTATVAAITTAYRVDSMILLPIINLSSGISTITAQSHGAGDTKRARRVLVTGNIIMLCVSLVLTLIVVTAGGLLISIFGVGSEALAIGKRFFVCIAAFYAVFGGANAIRGYLEGMGDVTFSGAVNIISLAVRIAGSYLLVGFFGNMVIAWAEIIAWILLLLMYIARLAYKLKRKA